MAERAATLSLFLLCESCALFRPVAHLELQAHLPMRNTPSKEAMGCPFTSKMPKKQRVSGGVLETSAAGRGEKDSGVMAC